MGRKSRPTQGIYKIDSGFHFTLLVEDHTTGIERLLVRAWIENLSQRKGKRGKTKNGKRNAKPADEYDWQSPLDDRVTYYDRPAMTHSAMAEAGHQPASKGWACSRCTFHNNDVVRCEMCGAAK